MHGTRCFLFIFIIAAISPAIAQSTTVSLAAQNSAQNVPKKRSFLSKIWGYPVKNSIFYEPIGSHTKDGHRRLKWFELAGGTFHSFFAMTFVNSFGDQTWAVGMQRYFYQNKFISLGYGFGAMYGYYGQLSNVSGIPLRNTFLFTGDINPVLGFLGDINMTKRVKISFIITPLVMTIGLRLVFG